MIDEILRRRRLRTEPGGAGGGGAAAASGRACLREMELYLQRGVNTRRIIQPDATLITRNVFEHAGLGDGDALTAERLRGPSMKR